MKALCEWMHMIAQVLFAGYLWMDLVLLTFNYFKQYIENEHFLF